MTKSKSLKIALLVGGTSPERQVSKSSGKSIYTKLIEMNYNVKLIDPAYGINQPENEEDFFCEKDFSEVSNLNCGIAINSSLMDNIDLVFIGLHGRWGEDGVIQSLLELRGLKYTGSDVLSSATAMNKNVSKILFRHYGVITPRWFTLDVGNDDIKITKDKINESFGFPCVVKPNNQGSTIGVTICKDETNLEEAIKTAFKYSDKLIIEEYIKGREITAAIIDTTVLPVLEIRPKHGYYDYECKYTSGMSEYIVPAEIPENIAHNLKQQALLAFNSVNASGYARMDFRLGEDNKTYCLEVNTLPGMTSTSLVPKMAKAAGMDFGELLERIIQMALK
jgi:D-alanine-D-alanine ligase